MESNEAENAWVVRKRDCGKAEPKKKKKVSSKLKVEMRWQWFIFNQMVSFQSQGTKAAVSINPPQGTQLCEGRKLGERHEEWQS